MSLRKNILGNVIGLLTALKRWLIISAVAVYTAQPAIGAEISNGHTTIGGRLGEKTGEAYLSFMVPLQRTSDSLLFFNPRAALKDEGEAEGNIGLGYRKLINSGKAIVGGNVFFDRRRSSSGHTWNQWGAGLEVLTDKVDARINYYDPDNDQVMTNEVTIDSSSTDVSTSVSRSTTTSSNSVSSVVGTSTSTTNNGVSFQGNNLIGSLTDTTATTNRLTTTTTAVTTTRLTTTTTVTTMEQFLEQFEGGLKGYDAEVGLKLSLPANAPETRVFAGYYDFENPFGEDISGAKARVEMRAGPYLTFDAEVFEDELLNGSKYFVGARLRLPFNAGKMWADKNPFKAGNIQKSLKKFKARKLESRIIEDDIIRDVRIQTRESELEENLSRRKVNKEVDTNVQVSQSVQTTTTIQDTATSTSSGRSATLTNNGAAITVTHVDDNNAGDPNDGGGVNDGTYENPHTSAADANGAVDRDIILVHGGSTLTAALNVDSDDRLLGEGSNVVHMVTTDQMGSVALPETAPGAGAGANPTTAGVSISSNDVEVNNLIVNNGSISTAPGTTHTNLTIRNIVVNGSPASTDAIELGQGGMLDGNIILQNIVVNNAGENSIDINNVLATGRVMGTNINTTGGIDDALDIDDALAGSQFTFNNFRSNGAGDDGIDIEDSQGTFTFTNVNVGTVMDDGILIEDSGGTFTFNNATVMTPSDEGLQISGTTGTFNFNNLDITNAGEDGIQIIDNDATINFDANSSVTGSGEDGFYLEDGDAQVTYTGTIDHQRAGAGEVIEIFNTGNASHIIFNSSVANAIVGTNDGISIDGAAGRVDVRANTRLSGDDGVFVGGASGIFNFDDTHISNILGSSGAGVVDGALELFGNTNTAMVTFGASSSITQGVNQSAVNVDGPGPTDDETQFVFNGTIDATNGDGLQFDNADGSYAFNGGVTLNGGDAGIDILNDSDGTFTFANTNITNPTGTAINVDGGSADINYNGGTINQANNASTLVVSNDHDGTITFANAGATTINATNGDGLQFDDADGTYNFNGAVTLNGGDAGIDLLNDSDGTFTFANTNITNPTGTAFNVEGGSADVNFNGGTIAQANNASTVSVSNGHDGTIIIANAANINATNGNGLQFDNADGTYNFNGTTTLNGGDAGIDILDDSDGTFTFGTTTTITNPTGDALVVNGNGTNNPNITYSGTITNNSGRVISISNVAAGANQITFNSAVADAIQDSGAGTGISLNNANQNVNFNTDIELTGAEGIDILNSGGTFTFTDTDIALTGTTGPALEINGGASRVLFNNTNNSINQTVDQTAILVQNGHTGELDFDGTIDATHGRGLVFNNADGTYDFSGNVTLNGVANNADTGIDILNGSAGTFTFSGLTTIANNQGVAVNMDSSSGTLNLNNVDINQSVGNGIQANNSGTVNVTGAIDNVTGDGINIVNTNLNANSVIIGANGTIGDDGIDISNTDATSRTATVQNSNIFNIAGTSITDRGITIASTGTGTLNANVRTTQIASNNQTIFASSGANANSLILDLTDNGTLRTNNAVPTMEVRGGGLHSTIVTTLGANTTQIIGNGVSGGVLFDRVTFDADGVTGNGFQQVTGGTLQVGSGTGAAQRVQGDGVSFLATSGDLNFTELDIFNNAGTGFEVDTKSPPGPTTFNLVAGASSTVNTTGGSAMFLDPLTGNLSFDTVTSTNATNLGATNLAASGNGTGITVDGLTATGGVGTNALTIGTLNVSNSAGDGVLIQNNGPGNINIGATGGATITDAGGDGIEFRDNDMQTAVTFGTTNIDMGASSNTAGINYEGTNGPTTFGDTTISDIGNGMATNQVGINFNNATLTGAANYNSVTMTAPAATSTSSVGVDLTGIVGNQNVNLGSQASPGSGPSSSITDLHRGVVIDATAAVQFTFGDGESPSDTGSTIDVNGLAGSFTVDLGGVNPLAASNYDFEDVAFGAGDMANLPGAAGSATFVSTTGNAVSMGTNGIDTALTAAQVFTVAEAEAMGNSGQTFVFVGDAGGSIDVTGGGTDGFTLLTGQAIDGFGNGNTISFGTVQPGNVLGNLGATGANVTANAATASNSNAGGTSVVNIGAGSGTNMIRNNIFSGTSNVTSVINVAGASSGPVTLQGIDITNIGAGDAGISLDGNSVAVNLTDVDLTGSNAGTALQIDSTTSSTGQITVDATSDIDGTTGTIVSIGGGARNVNLNAVNLIASNNTLNVIDIEGQTGGTIQFGDLTSDGATGTSVIESTGQTNGNLTFGSVAIGNTTGFNNAAGTAVILAGNPSGSVAFTELDIVATDGDGLSATSVGLAITNTDNDITANSGRALILNGNGINAAGITFDQVVSTDSSTDGVSLFTMNTGDVTINSLDVNNATNNGIRSLGSVNTISIVEADIDGAGTRGVDIATTTNISIGTGAAGLAVDGAATDGIAVRGNNGTVNLGTGTGGGVQIGTTTAPGGHGIAILANTQGNINIGNATTVSSISSGTGADNDGINVNNADATITVTSVDINQTGSGTDGHGISVTDDDTTGSFTLNGTSTIDGANGDGLNASGASVAISGVTIGGTTAPGDDGIDISDGVQNINVAVDNVTVTNTGAAGTGINIDGSGAGSVTITSFNGNTITDAAAGGVNIDDATFDATPGGAINQVTGGNLHVGTIGNRVEGDGVRLNNVLGSVAFADVDIFNNNGTGLFVRDFAGKTGTFTIATTSGTIDTTNGTAVDIDPVMSSFALDSVSSTNANGQGSSAATAGGLFFDAVDAIGGAGSNAVNIGTVSVTNATNDGININNSTGTFTFGNTTINNAGSNGGGVDVDVSATDNTTVAFTGGLDIDTGSGTGVDAREAAGGTLNFNVTNAGTETINTTSGTALNLDGANTNATFDSITSTALNGNIGIDINNHTGSLTVNGGTLTNTGAGDAIEITGGNGTINIASNVNSSGATGRAADITGRTGGSVTLSGNLTDNNATGGGINVANSTAGTTTFSGTTKTVNTFSTTAVNMTNNNGHTVNFTGGGLNIDTTTGTGVNATNNGTLSIVGANNTIDTTTGVGFFSNDVTFGGSGVTFNSINVNASGAGIASNGIYIDNAGSNGFTVNGGTLRNLQGANFSGGVVDGRANLGNEVADADGAGAGVYLRDTSNVTLSGVTIRDTQNFGIRGLNAGDITLTNVNLTGTHGNTSALEEGSIALFNLTGTNSITGGSIGGGEVNNIKVVQATNADMTLNIDNVTFNFTDTTNGNDDIQIIQRHNAGNVTVSVTGSTFNGSPGDYLQVSRDSTGAQNVTFTGNTIRNNHLGVGAAGGGVVNIFTAGTASGTEASTFNISNNMFFDGLQTNHGGIAIGANGDSVYTGTISDNMIFHDNVTAINLVVQQTGSLSVTANNNQFDNEVTDPGTMGPDQSVRFNILTNGSNTTFNLNADNNSQQDGSFGTGFFGTNLVLLGDGAGNNSTVCIDLTNHSGPAGLFDEGWNINLQNNATSSLNLPGLVALNQAGADDLLTLQNPLQAGGVGGAGAFVLGGSAVGNFTYTGAGSSCP